MARKRLGELLLERGLIDMDQLNSALAYQRQWGHRLGTAMVAKGFLSEGTLTRVLSESLQIPMVDLSKVVIDKKAIAAVKRATAEQFEIIPIAIKEHKGRKTLLLAMADPLNVAAIDEVAFTTDMTVRPAIAQISSLKAALRVHYYGERIDIPPLDFSNKPHTDLDAPDDAHMTIIRRGGAEEEIVDTDSSEVIDLTKEVEAAERLAAQQAGGQPTPLVDPFTGQATGQFTYYAGQPTGAYMMAVPQVQVQPPAAPAAPAPAPAAPAVAAATVDIMSPDEPVEALEKKFWALMRVLARKGLITKEEFLAELKND